MTMVIGLNSGKEYLVKDKSYTFENSDSGEVIRAFESLDGKRVITVPSHVIEFFDEEATSEVLTALEGANQSQGTVREENNDLYG